MQTAQKHVRRALSRARWSVLQTGLITTALAVFGVYVLASRVDEIYALDWRALRWIPMGAIVVGALAASGYLVGAQWTGLRIRGWLLVTILLLQFAAYGTAHYAQFVTRHLIWQNNDTPVGFFSYFRYATMNLGADPDQGTPFSPRTCVMLRTLEAFLFMLPAILSVFIHMRRRCCLTCGGVTRDRPIGAVSSPNDLAHLAQLAAVSANGDARPIANLLRPEHPPSPPQMPVTLSRCVVCGYGALRADLDTTPIKLSPQLTDNLWSSPSPS